MNQCYKTLCLGLTIAGLAMSSVALQAAKPVSKDPKANNILVIVADDFGVDIPGIYGEAGQVAPTPNIDALAAEGVLFRNAWSNTVCSPTRATIQTGRYGFRTGVRWVTFPSSSAENALKLDEFIIPEALDSRSYAHAAIGKWHLSTIDTGGADGPNMAGYSHYSGALYNIGNYFNWPRTLNGITENTQTYATTANVNDALAWINTQESNRPWFMWLAFNAPHSPFHVPPPDLHNFEQIKGLTTCPDVAICYRAMVEAMDKEIGRLLSALPVKVRKRTTVIFVGDNGTPSPVTIPQTNRNKFTLYEGGINVPLIISGAGVENPNRESAALVNTTDFYATILEMAGVDVATVPTLSPLDSISLKPILDDTFTGTSLRQYAYSEVATPFGSMNDGRTIRNQRYKLIQFDDVTFIDEFYDLGLDPEESNNLIVTGMTTEEQTVLADLTNQLVLLTGQ